MGLGEVFLFGHFGRGEVQWVLLFKIDYE